MSGASGKVTPNGSGTEMVMASGSAVATPIAKDAAATPPDARVTDVMMRSMTSLPLANRPSRQPPSPTADTGSDQLYLRIQSVVNRDRAVAVAPTVDPPLRDLDQRFADI